MECVCSVSYSFLINNTPFGNVTPSRGLRQGDPLSPYLFILCTEVLSGMCTKAQERGLLPGIKVARGSPPVNHLLFADDTMFFCKSSAACCTNLITILKRYEQASGQSINLTKSAITFSSKTPADAKRRVKATLHIDSEGGIGKYLGLPEHFGRRKRDIFASIVDRIRQRAHSWTSRFLSGAGKQVLLQSILTSIPTYAMSCFKLPLSLCKQIQSIFTRYWWDDKPDKRKMSWVAWEKLTLPKACGGLGFRDIVAFNDALLAKLSWRIQQYPDSLLARVLLGKYCHSSSFMECVAPSSSSHGWRGILAGREILRQGAGWIIGNGTSINVWNQKWLSTSKPSAPIGPPPENATATKVSDLLDNTNDWNLANIRQLLPQYEADIRKLMPPSSPSPDTLSWLPEKSGSYSTKSGYALARINRLPISTNSFNWRRCVWNLPTAPKLKLFLWKITNKALPVGSNLQTRGLNTFTTCKRCAQPEDELHLLLHCEFAAQVWALAPLFPSPIFPSITSCQQLLQAMAMMKNLPPTGLTSASLPSWIVWHLWKARNHLIFENKCFTAEQVMLKAITDARLWQEAQQILRQPKPCTVRPMAQTRLPLPEVSRCYMDAAWCPITGHSGAGWVFQDSNQNTLFSSSSSKLFVSSALSAEAIALKASLLSAINADIKRLNVFSDSQILVKLMNSDGVTNELKGILQDIRSLCTSFDFICFSYFSRKNNVAADALAKSALLSVTSSLSRG